MPQTREDLAALLAAQGDTPDINAPVDTSQGYPLQITNPADRQDLAQFLAARAKQIGSDVAGAGAAARDAAVSAWNNPGEAAGAALDHLNQPVIPPHVYDAVTHGIADTVSRPQQTLNGQVGNYDPQTGHMSQDAINWGINAAGLAQTGGLGGAGSEGVNLGAGAIRKGAAPAEQGAAKFPQYAEQYPPTLPGQLMTDAKTGKEYLGKVNSPEAEAFAKERQAIMKDMQKNGYEPYYNPDERFYVDNSHPAYQPNQNTLDIVPKKQATIDNDLKTIGSDEARARLQQAYAHGQQMPNTEHWYAMGQLERDFVKHLGPEEGPKAFANNFATSMAATTGGAAPTDNLLMAQYGNYLRAHDLPYPTAAHEMPFPIGGRYATANMEQHKKIMDAGGSEALGLDGANPKRHNFAQNFMGNRNVATMDEQMTSGMVPGLNVPQPGKYGLYERVLHEEAAKAGVPPANYQDVGWSGFKSQKDPKYASGQPMIQTVNETIERTHRLTGMPKHEIVERGLVKGEIPLYSQNAWPFMTMPDDQHQ